MDIDHNESSLENNLSDESSEIYDENCQMKCGSSQLSNNYKKFFEKFTQLNIKDMNYELSINNINNKDNETMSLNEVQNDNDYQKINNMIIKPKQEAIKRKNDNSPEYNSKKKNKYSSKKKI